jgi:hypothetical protein
MGGWRDGVGHPSDEASLDGANTGQASRTDPPCNISATPLLGRGYELANGPERTCQSNTSSSSRFSVWLARLTYTCDTVTEE